MNDDVSVWGGMFLAHLEDSVPEGGLQVRVRNFLHTHVVHEAEVLALLLSLKLVDSNLTMVNCEEMNQLLVISNILVGDFDCWLEVDDVLLLALTGFKDTLKCSLSLRKLFELLLVVTLFGLGGWHHLNDTLSASECITHALQIQEFTLDHKIGLFVRVA